MTLTEDIRKNAARVIAASRKSGQTFSPKDILGRISYEATNSANVLVSRELSRLRAERVIRKASRGEYVAK